MSRNTGELKKFFADKGYGFIKTEKNDIFFHVNDSTGINTDALQEGISLSYEITQDNRGKTKACNVQIEQ